MSALLGVLLTAVHVCLSLVIDPDSCWLPDDRISILQLGISTEPKPVVAASPASSPVHGFGLQPRPLATPEVGGLEKSGDPPIFDALAPKSADCADNYTIMVLHIGKNGGTSLSQELKPALDPARAEWKNHEESRNVLHSCSSHPTRKFDYFVRDPVKRYVSGWIEAYRLGWPDYIRLWYPEEFLAFMRFYSPDELARSLDSEDHGRREAAKTAMQHIEHVKWSQANGYWGGLENFARCAESNLFVGMFEYLDSEYSRLVDDLDSRCALLDSNLSRVLPAAHRTPEKYDGWKHLSRRAVQNLRDWYRDDYFLISNLSMLGLVPDWYVQEIQEDYPHYESGVNRLSMASTWLMVAIFSLVGLFFTCSIVVSGLTCGKRCQPDGCDVGLHCVIMRTCSIISSLLVILLFTALLLFLLMD